MSVLFGLLSEVYDISPQWYQYALYTVNGYTSYIYTKKYPQKSWVIFIRNLILTHNMTIMIQLKYEKPSTAYYLLIVKKIKLNMKNHLCQHTTY